MELGENKMAERQPMELGENKMAVRQPMELGENKMAWKKTHGASGKQNGVGTTHGARGKQNGVGTIHGGQMFLESNFLCVFGGICPVNPSILPGLGLEIFALTNPVLEHARINT